MMQYGRPDERLRQIHSFDKFDRLTERQILAFQDLLVTNGIHYIDVDSFSDARRFVASFTHMLGSSKRIACLTTANPPLDSDVISLYDDLALAGSCTNLPQASISLETFLLQEFYYDFVWVECTSELLEKPWFWHFEQKLSEFNLGATFPILMFYVKSF